jgi:hypothetical protein
MYVPPKQNWNDEHSNVPVQWWALIGSCFSPLHHLQGSLLFHLLILILIHGYIGTPTCPTICISTLWEQLSWLLCMRTLETIQTCSPNFFSHLIVKIKNRDHNQEGSWWQKRNNFCLWYRSGDMLGTNYISVFPILHVATRSLWVDLLLKTLDTTKMKYFPLVLGLPSAKNRHLKAMAFSLHFNFISICVWS